MSQSARELLSSKESQDIYDEARNYAMERGVDMDANVVCLYLMEEIAKLKKDRGENE